MGGHLQQLASSDYLIPFKNKPDCTSRTKKQKGHCSLKAFTHSANQWEEESSSCAGTDVSDWQDKTFGHALLVCFMREREVSLGHADRKLPKTLRGTEREEQNVLTVVSRLYLPRYHHHTRPNPNHYPNIPVLTLTQPSSGKSCYTFCDRIKYD